MLNSSLCTDFKRAVTRPCVSAVDKPERFETQLEALRKQGAKVRVLRHSEVAHWQQVTRYREIQADWVIRQEVSGVKDAGPAMQQVTDIMTQVMR